MLVIIGLLVGGVLVGQDLIRAAHVRATITQIEKYQTAVNTFRGKYGYLPGDIPDPTASQFGFVARGTFAGEGDGNGVIEGVWGNAAGRNGGWYEIDGETSWFWLDLGTANLIDTVVGNTGINPPGGTLTSTTLNGYFPAAKTGQGNFIYVWSNTATNYFGLSAIRGVTMNNFTSSLALLWRKPTPWITKLMTVCRKQAG